MISRSIGMAIALRGLDHAVHVRPGDLVVLAREHRDHAAAVDAADVVAGDAGADRPSRACRPCARPRPPRAGCWRPSSRGPRRPAAVPRSARSPTPTMCSSSVPLPAGVRDDAGDLGGADVESDVHPCRLSHGAAHPLLGIALLAAAAGPLGPPPPSPAAAPGAGRPRARRAHGPGTPAGCTITRSRKRRSTLPARTCRVGRSLSTTRRADITRASGGQAVASTRCRP